MTMDDRFRRAAWAYFGYGVVYWLGGAWLAWHGIGVRAGASRFSPAIWLLVGLVFVGLIPFLLYRRRRFFERWVLSRRDFARILFVFMVVRAAGVANVGLGPDGGSVPAPWGGLVSLRTGATVFFFVTVAASVLVAWAAWSDEPSA
ncbi:MAG: hypothetical protein HYU51_05325 [Candidatus Rokubacteria bacterium]|nr:hypothetical protein [Candidatus Rokubacteria bacterium]